MPADNRPNNPSDGRIKYLRFQHPTDPAKVIQLATTYTGVDCTDGVEIWELAIGGGGGPLPAVPGTSVHAYFALPDGVANQLPTLALVNGGVIIADENNTANIVIGGDGTIASGNAPEIPPGGSLPITAQNLDQFWVRGTTADIITFLGG